jgi:hypothetical protein
MATRAVGLVWGWLFVVACCGTSAGAEFTAVAGFDQQLFPSYLIATAGIRLDKGQADPTRLGDPTGQLGVDLVALAKNTPVQVTIECDDIMEPSVFSGTLATEGTTYRITPKVKYRYGLLAQWEQTAPVTITYRVRVGKLVEQEQSVTCMLRSINDCPFLFRDGDAVVDASFTFAAYVNEQHPFVDKLLREALDRAVVTKFTGYQTGRTEEVLQQAYALWDLLVARDIRYSSITATAVESDTVISQHVRLIEDSINNSQANCVDGSVLWVSLLRKIGIDAFLVVTPNHCYAGFYLDAKRKQVYAVETTLLGSEVTEAEIRIPRRIAKAIPVELRYEESFASFVAALETGTKAYEASKAQAAKTSAGQPVGKTRESSAEPAAVPIQVIDIALMRRRGVLPIAFQNRVEFVGYDFRYVPEEEAPAEEGDAAAMDAPVDATVDETASDSASEPAAESESETGAEPAPEPVRAPRKAKRGPTILDTVGSGVYRKE